MHYTLTKPCPKCPFRSDIRPYLRPARVREITESLARGEFPCHETVAYNDDGEGVITKKSQHCAGALIVIERMERPSQMIRIMERLGFYDRRMLNMRAPVYASFTAMIRAAQREERARARNIKTPMKH